MPQADIWTVSGLSLQTVGAPGGMRQMWQGRFTHDDSTSEGVHGYPVPRNNDRCLCAWRRVARAIAAHESLLMIVCAKYCVSQNYLTHATNGGHDSRAGAT